MEIYEKKTILVNAIYTHHHMNIASGFDYSTKMWVGVN